MGPPWPQPGAEIEASHNRYPDRPSLTNVVGQRTSSIVLGWLQSWFQDTRFVVSRIYYAGLQVQKLLSARTIFEVSSSFVVWAVRACRYVYEVAHILDYVSALFFWAFLLLWHRALD